MTAFKAAYSNELSKLRHRKKYLVFLIIGLAICAIWAGLVSVVSMFMGEFGGWFVGFVPTAMGVLPFFLQFLLPLLIFMAATDLITTEGAEATMKGCVCRPVARWKLFAGKLLAIMTYVAFYLACIFVLSTVLNQILGGHMSAGLNDVFAALASYALTLPPLAVLAAFAALIALIGRSPSLTMLLLIGIYAAMHILPVVFPIFSEMLFTSYLSWHRMWIGILPSAGRLLHMSAILLGYGVVFLIIGSLIFEKKEY